MKGAEAVLYIALACGLAACKNTAQQAPPAPMPPASPPAQARAAASASTATLSGDSLLNAPRNYLKNTVGNIGAAKEAVKVYEKSEAESMTLDAYK